MIGLQTAPRLFASATDQTESAALSRWLWRWRAGTMLCWTAHATARCCVLYAPVGENQGKEAGTVDQCWLLF